MNNPTIKKGFTFTHDRFVMADMKTPDIYVVTKVALGVVYYRALDGGAPWKMNLGEFVTRFAERAI